MISFEYASPGSVQDALPLLDTKWGPAEILAGGTDLVALMKDYVVTPRRLVNIKKITGISGVKLTAQKGLRIGALVTLDELAKHRWVTKYYPTLALAIGDAASPQIRNRATLGGNLCQRPRCWYFRNGFGLIALDAKGQSLVLKGDNRYHAILGNEGPAYFVSPSTVAPTLIAHGAAVVIQGPKGSRQVLLEDFYVTPTKETQREHDLRPYEILVEIRIPPSSGRTISYYEVRQKYGFDWPFATATIAMNIKDQRFKIHSNHESWAPIPWRSKEAEVVLAGERLTPACRSRCRSSDEANKKSWTERVQDLYSATAVGVHPAGSWTRSIRPA